MEERRRTVTSMRKALCGCETGEYEGVGKSDAYAG
jgi:hypothetical protein